MKLDKEQQNTFIMIFTVLIVSLVALIATANVIWGIVAQPVADARNAVAYFLRVENLNYNFAVPPSTQQNQLIEINPPEILEDIINDETPIFVEIREDPIIETSSNETVTLVADTRIINYNFNIPLINTNQNLQAFQTFPDAIIQDAILAGYGSGTDTPQVNLQILIPKIGINSPVLQGLGANDLLEKGFWTYPSSNKLGEGEQVFLCHRRFFGPYDPRSCWFLDQIKKGDEILLKFSGTDLNYEVVGVNVFDGDDPLIYSISNKEDYIKLVTCTPLYSNEQRLVVLAKRVK